VAQHFERAVQLDFPREALDELLLHLRPVMFAELLPLLGLSGQDKVERIAWDETERGVVVLGGAAGIAAGQSFAVAPDDGLLGRAEAPGGVGAAREQGGLDGRLEAALGDVWSDCD